MIKRIDEWLMKQAQLAYLWFYDWTGIYAAVLTYSMTMAFVLSHGSISWMGVLVLAIWFVPETQRFMSQKSGNFTLFNMRAREWQSNISRWVCTGLFFGFAVADIISVHIIWLVGDTLLIAVYYLLTAQIRKREPRGFGRLVPQGAGS